MTEAPDTPQQDQLPAKSQAQAQRDRMDALVAAVEGRSAQLKTLLGDTGISFDRFVEVFRRALIKGAEKPSTNLLLADAGSVIQACIDACTAGVLPDGKKGAIVIYSTNVADRGQPKRWIKKAQFLVMYEGMLQIAYASGNFTSIMAHVVYETDEWDYELGITPWIKHKPGPRSPRPEGAPEYQVIGAYAVAKTTNGGVFVEVFEPQDIRKVMSVSKATSGPAKDWPEQMARKGPLRRMWKFLPRDSRMDRILEVDDEAYEAEIPEPEAERKLSPGFRPQAALPEGAGLVMDPVETESEEESVPVAPEREVKEDAHVIHDGPVGTFGSPGLEKVEPPPWAAAFSPAIEKATSWLNLKQALKTLAKTEPWEEMAGVQTMALNQAWERFQELGDRTDFVTDPWLFACWLAADERDPESVEANWRILEATEAYKKADDALRALLVGLYAAAVNEEDTGS